MMAKLDNFQQTKRRAMAMSYARFLWALAHIRDATCIFEMRQLPWLKRNGRRPRKTSANSEPFM